MSIRHKVQFPTPGCIVEFLQGNSPILGYVLEAQGDKVRLYTQAKKETKLPIARLLPWYGPAAASALNRAEMEALFNEHLTKRQAFQKEVNLEELWQLAEGEITKASAGWFASLVWDEPDIDAEAGMGHALLGHKTHFKFSPPEFEIYGLEAVERRIEEARAAELREALALHGNKFFIKLWDIHLGKAEFHEADLPPPAIAHDLHNLLHAIMGETDGNDALWKLVTRGLPNDPHLALHLATAWGIVPKHYNFLLNKAGYEAAPDWAAAFATPMTAIRHAMDASLHAHATPSPTPFITIDPESTIDRDDAFFVTSHADGSFTLHVAIACPSLHWPFGTPFDKEVLRRSTSLYLPEGDLHMLPHEIGCSVFSLDAHQSRMALITTLDITADGEISNTNLSIEAVSPVANMTLCEAETLLTIPLTASVSSDSSCVSPHPQPSSGSESTAGHSAPDTPKKADIGTDDSDKKVPSTSLDADTAASESLLQNLHHEVSPSSSESDDDNGETLSMEHFFAQETITPDFPRSLCPETIATHLWDYQPLLQAAAHLAKVLRAKRLRDGAVILERPDADVTLIPLGASAQKSLATTDEESPNLAAVSKDTNTASAETALTRLPETAPSTSENYFSETSPAPLAEDLPPGMLHGEPCIVQLAQAPDTPQTHRIIGEIMIAANAAMGQWGHNNGIPLLYRNQDVALPDEYAAVWNAPQDIAKIARSLPAASLETLPKRHAGLGITAYATCTSPMRRYVDLLNQGQIINFISQGSPRFTNEELGSMLPLLQARLDSIGQVQRTRPRYWKLLFFRQQGDRAWWPGIVTEENSAFVTVALPWAQMMVRGRRKIFDEKIAPGTHVMIRVGKVHPLQNEITVMECLEE